VLPVSLARFQNTKITLSASKRVCYSEFHRSSVFLLPENGLFLPSRHHFSNKFHSAYQTIFGIGAFCFTDDRYLYHDDRGRKEKVRIEHEPRIALAILEGILIGFLTGLVGAGGGFLIIPALVVLTGLPFKTAVGTSLFVIAINALTGFLGDVINYDMNWPFLLLLTSLATAGIFIGNRLTHAISGFKLRRSFGWFVLVVGVWIFFKETLAQFKRNPQIEFTISFAARSPDSSAPLMVPDSP
jgi:hypothetical protein